MYISFMYIYSLLLVSNVVIGYEESMSIPVCKVGNPSQPEFARLSATYPQPARIPYMDYITNYLLETCTHLRHDSFI